MKRAPHVAEDLHTRYTRDAAPVRLIPAVKQ